MKRIADYWFTNRGDCIGVVLGEDEFKQRAYIKNTTAENKEADIQFVLDYGAKLTCSQAIGFFGDLVKPDIYKS